MGCRAGSAALLAGVNCVGRRHPLRLSVPPPPIPTIFAPCSVNQRTVGVLRGKMMILQRLLGQQVAADTADAAAASSQPLVPPEDLMDTSPVDTYGVRCVLAWNTPLEAS